MRKLKFNSRLLGFFFGGRGIHSVNIDEAFRHPEFLDSLLLSSGVTDCVSFFSPVFILEDGAGDSPPKMDLNFKHVVSLINQMRNPRFL